MKKHRQILWAALVTIPIMTGSATAQDAVPVISDAVKTAAQKINEDARVKAMLNELNTAEDAQYRFNTHMEITRIASPSRYELRRAREITKRFIDEWGFSENEIKTTESGNLPGAGLQIVDGLPVYNACVEIKGTYSSSQGAQSYNGQYPKVVIEGHIDTVNPATLPPESNPYEPVKLQPYSEALVTTPAELTAIANELHFDANGRIIQDDNYAKAYRRFNSAAAATEGGAYRIYVPGFADAMGNTTGVLWIARLMKKHNIKPVYDMWICATAGEEGKGNLAGMKQLYGYNQDTGLGNNALNVVSNLSVDGGGGTINYLGSYRFEMKYTEPDSFLFGNDEPKPSALNAMALAVEKISNIKTAWDDDKTATKVTYTVGVANCEYSLTKARSASCSIETDMRSPTLPPLNEIRAEIEPMFQAGATAENARFGIANTSDKAIKVETVWFGDRPAHKRENLSDPVIQAAWQAAETAGVDVRTSLETGSTSLNDNVPAAVGVPSINLNIQTFAASGGGHAFYEWGIPGNAATEALRIYRVMLAGLIVAGLADADGNTINAPTADPIGPRTTTDLYN